MSILIPGIDMPDSCDNCLICNRCEGNCDISDADYLPNKRPDDCPLIELPPHGDLIDRSKIVYTRDACGFRTMDFAHRAQLENITPVIPAEEGGSGNV